MRKSFAFSVFAVVAVASSVAGAAERDLFSNVRADSVFVPSNGAAAASPAQKATDSRISDGARLAQLLEVAGLNATRDGSRAVVSKTTVAGRAVPVQATISEDQNNVSIALLLSVAGSSESVTTEKLLAMLEANRKHAPVSFAYQADQKRFEIGQTLLNRNIGSNELRRAVDQLVQVAGETKSLWQIEAPAANNASSDQAERNASTPSLVGKWSAARSKTEAFAVQFNGDNTFVLVYVNGGRQTRSNGKYSVSSSKLTLEGKDGFRLAGSINSPSNSEFRFVPENSTSTGLTFKRAK